VFFESGVVTLLLRVVQALDLPKARMDRRAVEVAERAHVAKLEADNAKLLTELKQAHLVLAEADAA
jgi:hypothetical protein